MEMAKYKKLMNSAKARFSDKLEGLRIKSAREFWDLLKVAPPPLMVDSEALVKHYEKLFTPSATLSDLEEKWAQHIPVEGNESTPFDIAEVTAAVECCKSNKAKGNSWITVELLKNQAEPELLEALTRLFNLFREKGMPPKWNEV
jgi:hypothetical protein